MKSHNLSDFMNKANPVWMSDAIIPKSPSTKQRRREKREVVLAIEIGIIKEKVDFTKFKTVSIDEVRG